MARLESNTSIKGLRKIDVKNSVRKTRVWAALTLLGLSALITLSFINENIFMEHIAICSFIISCIAIIKIVEPN